MNNLTHTFYKAKKVNQIEEMKKVKLQVIPPEIKSTV
jgi:hypothetical protein